jgi:hypothetical protein
MSAWQRLELGKGAQVGFSLYSENPNHVICFPRLFGLEVNLNVHVATRRGEAQHHLQILVTTNKLTLRILTLCVLFALKNLKLRHFGISPGVWQLGKR